MPSAETELVSAVRREIQARVGPARYELWFGPTTALSINGARVLVGVPNPFFKRWLAKHFEAVVKEAVKAVTGASPQVQFQVQANFPRAETEPNSPPKDPERRSAQHLARAVAKRSAPSISEHWAAIEDFVVGPCNRLAHAAALEACRWPPQCNVLVLYGSVGVGKTHLLQAVCGTLAAREPRFRIVYLTAEEFTNEFVTALRSGNMPSFRKRYRGLDVLAVDDMQFLAEKQATQEEFLHTLDSLVAKQRLVLLAADRCPGLLPLGSEALITRLQAGMSCAVDVPDFATREQIVEAKTARMQLDLPDEVRRWVAATFGASVREIEGALHSLRAHGRWLNGTLDLAEAQRLLAPLVRPAQRAVSLKDVERAVCELFGIEARVLRSSVRQRQVSQPRMLAMYLARKHTRVPYSDIGKYFGGRNHSTVISAQKKVQGWLNEHSAMEARHGRWTVDEALATLERALRAG